MCAKALTIELLGVDEYFIRIPRHTAESEGRPNHIDNIAVSVTQRYLEVIH